MTILTHDGSGRAGLADAMTKAEELQRLLRLFRAAVPCEGVVLATDDGVCVAHDLPPGSDPEAAAREAAWERRLVLADAEAKGKPEPASAFVEGANGLTLVVFVEPGFTLAAELPKEADTAVLEWSALDLGSSMADVITS